jgi:cupin fold WbuC family metalloprotein
MGLSGVQLIDSALIRRVTEGARQSPRKRLNHNFHGSPDEAVHRFLNVLTRDTYVAPHRHRDPPKHESFLVLEGQIAVFVFSDAGEITGSWILGGGLPYATGIDLPPGVWHTLIALSDSAVCYEVKPGPWDPATDKEFAPWAPAEQEPGAAAYRDYLTACAQSTE